MSSQINDLYEFGPFRIDSRERLLSCHGKPIAVTPKAFDTLLVLVQNSGHLLLKEELMKAVWPDSFVEEVNLSQNVSALRKALHDSAQESRYIATVPGKGYRFVAEVRKLQPKEEEAAEEAESLIVEKQSQSQIVIEQAKPWPVRTVIAGTMALLLALVFAGYRLRKANQTPLAAAAMQSRRSVAVLGFQNLSGRSDPAWLSTAFSEMLSTELASGDQLRLVSSEEVALLRNNLAISNTATLSKSTLAQIHQAIGADLVVLGSYSDLGKESGGKIRLDLRLQDTAAGETIATIAETGTEADLFQLVSTAGADLRERLGIPGLSEGDAAAVRASLPANPQAARLYAEGLAKLRVFDAIAARDFFEQAIHADPKYALAHSALSEAWSTLGYDRKAAEEARTAFDLSGTLARRDRLFIEARYRVMNKEWDKAIDLYHTLFNFFPDDIEYGLRLAATQIQAHKGTDALATIQAMRKLSPPTASDIRIELAEEQYYYQAGQYKLAEPPATRAVEKAKVQGVPLLLAKTLRTLAEILSLTGEPDKATAAAEQARGIYSAAGDQFGVAATLDSIGTALWFQGKYEDCEKIIRQALEINQSIGNKGGAARQLKHLASLRAARGDLEGAKRSYKETLTVEREIGDRHGEADALMAIAWTLQNQGQLAVSLDMYDQALGVFRDLSDESSIANALARKGGALTDLGDLESARQVIGQALTLFRKNGNRELVAVNLYVLGEIARYQAQQDEAQKDYREALAIAQEIRDDAAAHLAMLGLAQVANDEGRLGDAKRQISQLSESLRRQRDPSIEINAGSLLTEINLQQGSTTEASQAIESVREAARQDELSADRFVYSIAQARLRAAAGEASEARNALKGVLADATKQGNTYFQLEARLALCELDAKADPGAARLHSQALAKDAHRKGFEQIARKALAMGS